MNKALPDRLLSPQEFLFLLNEGLYARRELIARLDVAACHFMPRIADDAPPPLICTNYASYGQPSSGRLAFTPEDVAENTARGEKSILVVGPYIMAYELNCDRELFDKVEGFIIVCPEEKQKALLNYIHISRSTAHHNSVLLDNPLSPQIEYHDGNAHVTLSNGTILSCGEGITVDPLNGFLWKGVLEIIPCDYVTSPFVQVVKSIKGSVNVGFHMNRGADNLDRNKLSYTIYRRKRSFDIGLERKEIDFCNTIVRYDPQDFSVFFSALSAGAVPRVLKYWDDNCVIAGSEYRKHYRLLDIHCLHNYFPDDLRRELLENKDHIIGSNLFSIREVLYRHQLSTNLAEFIAEQPSKMAVPQTIVVPDVKTPEEVLYFKKLVQEVTPANVKHLIRFGVMMEAPGAFKKTEEIARHCDSLCYGLNDYTAARLRLDRGTQWDHWTFDRLHPVIAQETAQSIAAARAVNPNIFVNICGHQTAGHHVPSINMLMGACDRLGVRINQFTVPPRIDFALRTQLTIAQYFARRELGLPALC